MSDNDQPTVLEEAPERPCDGCGATDRHPRQAYYRRLDQEPELYHFDCIPAVLRRSLEADAGTQAGIDATASGLRGADVQSAVLTAALAEQENV